MAQPAAGGGSRRPWTLVVLCAATVIYVITLPFALVSALVSPVVFDSGASPAAWAYVGGVLSYPVLVVVSLIAAWLLYRRRRHRACLVLLLVPLVGAPLLALLTALLWGR